MRRFNLDDHARLLGGDIEDNEFVIEDQVKNLSPKSGCLAGAYPQETPIWLAGVNNAFIIRGNTIIIRNSPTAGGSIWVSSITGYDSTPSNQTFDIHIEHNRIFHNSKDEAISIFNREGDIHDVRIADNVIYGGIMVATALLSTNAVLDKPFGSFVEGAFYDESVHSSDAGVDFSSVISSSVCNHVLFRRIKGGASLNDNPDTFVASMHMRCPSGASDVGSMTFPPPFNVWRAEFVSDETTLQHRMITVFRDNIVYAENDIVVQGTTPDTSRESLFVCKHNMCRCDVKNVMSNCGWMALSVKLTNISVTGNVLYQSGHSVYEEKVGRDTANNRLTEIRDVIIASNTYDVEKASLPAQFHYIHVSQFVHCLTIRDNSYLVEGRRWTTGKNALIRTGNVPACPNPSPVIDTDK